MKASESGFQTLDAEILRVQDHLSSLQAKRARCEAHTEKLRIAVAPHNSLPPEILAEVFLYCLHHDPLDGRLAILRPSPHPLLAPWVLGHVCSKWRQIALGEKRLWNSIYYEGNLRRHALLLKEAFKRSGQSAIQLEARESENKVYKPFFRDVIHPQSRRITSLLLVVATATFKDFLLLPPGLFNELECVKLQILQDYGSISSIPPATVFQGAPRLRRATIPFLDIHPSPDLALPWNQLTYLALMPGDIEVTDSLKVLRLCTNLRECHLSPCSDDVPPIQVFPSASIQLPHLRKLGLGVNSWSPHADFFRPLVIPKLEKFTLVLSSSSEDYLNALRVTIDHLSIPDLRLELHYDGRDRGAIMRLARFLPPLSSIKAYECSLSASMMALIGQEMCFQTLTSLEVRIDLCNTENVVEMFKTHWAHAQQSNNTHIGIRSATIEAINASEEDISEFSRDIAVIQKQLGVTDAKITLRRWRPDAWRF